MRLAPVKRTSRAVRAALLARLGRRWLGRGRLRALGALTRLGRNGPERLVIAPGDIRTADPTRAEDIYAGYFVFAGRMVRGEGRAPFDVPPPTPDFARELAGFGWLRHMRGAGTSLARSNARTLVKDFLTAEPRLRKGPAGEPAVAARRILSWMSAAPFVLSGADADFYRAYMRGLGRDAAIVIRRYGETTARGRLLAGVALTELALSADLGGAAVKRAAGVLAAELPRQIFADGGHVGRNPETLIDLLLDFLPLRQAFAARNQPAPPALLNAIDRAIPTLRLLRHGDGSLALFNGMGRTELDHLATVLAFADARGRALLSAPQSGYHRLEAGDAVLIVDAGAPPPLALSQGAHAGCLSLEFSLGRDHVVINCGAPPLGKPAAREAARQTAAHSTLVLDDTSSCRFASATGLERVLDGAIVAGPRTVTAERHDVENATVLDLSHDGYVPSFGLSHVRRLALSHDGGRVLGEDRLASAKTGERFAQRFDIRFHLHPLVMVNLAEDTLSATLSAGSHNLVFEAGGIPLSLEESVLFASSSGAQRTQQIVVSGAAVADAAVPWSFRRI